MNGFIICCCVLVVFLLGLVGFTFLSDWKDKKDAEIKYLQKAFKDLSEMFEIKFTVSTYDGEIYLNRPSRENRQNFPVGQSMFEEMSKKNEERWTALAQHLSIRFIRNTQLPIDEVVVVKTK